MSHVLASFSRAQRLSQIQQGADNTLWDMIVVGGGITGAGILLTASQAGLKVL